jgi:hypothetical protein
MSKQSAHKWRLGCQPHAPAAFYSSKIQTPWLFTYAQAEWTPFQTHYYSKNLVAPGIKLGISETAARSSDH